VNKAMNAATGSQGFVAAARATWLFTRETDEGGTETGRTLMLPVKNNLSARRHNGMAYRILGADLGGGISAPYVSWDDEPVTVSADAALAAAMGRRRRGKRRSSGGHAVHRGGVLRCRPQGGERDRGGRPEGVGEERWHFGEALSHRPRQT